MKTLLILQSSLRIGGAEMMAAEIAEQLDRTRFRPIVCCLYAPGPLGERLMREGIPLYHHLGAHRWDPRIPFRLIRLLRRERVDILYMINQPIVQGLGTLCGKLARVPVLISCVQSTGKVRRIHRRLLINRLTFPWVRTVTALSQTHKDYLVQQEGIDPGKLEIIPNSVHPDRFKGLPPVDRLRAELNLQAGEPLVGIVAMLRPEKAHEHFLQAAALVLRQVSAARFLIIGEGPERPRLEQAARSLGIESRVHFLGARDDVPSLLQLLDVAVLCSRPVVEALSVAVLEYMISAKPVIATRVGSLPELVEDGRTGFLVEYGDWRSLADRIVRLLRDRPLASSMGAEGKKRVEARYTVQQMVGQLEALFNRCA